MSTPNRPGSLVAAVAASTLAITACGGSHRAVSSSTNRASAGSAGPIHATLVGEDHSPRAGKNWSYTVTATDSQGRRLSGTVRTEFAFSGAVVGRETPPVHPLKNGRLKDELQFPARSAGFPIQLQVVVHTGAGSATLHWPVTIRK